MLKLCRVLALCDNSKAAAFRRLCVETLGVINLSFFGKQPPSGGCVLKLPKPLETVGPTLQPPSGGCVLKLQHCKNTCHSVYAAAFRRLCVETRDC